MKLSPEMQRRVLEMAGLPVAQPVSAKPVRTSAPRRMVIEVDVPVYARIEANTGGSLRGKIKRKTALGDITAESLPRLSEPFPLPCVVTLTRYSAKKPDDENSSHSLKAVRDAVADWLGVDDGDETKVRWRYRRAAGWVACVRIRVEHGS
jgi:hypothetical protein